MLAETCLEWEDDLMGHFDPEAVDLAQLASRVRANVESAEGTVMGLTRIRNEVVRLLGCSLLEGEQLVDTMVQRGFIVKTKRGGLPGWSIPETNARR
jgi:hypothetical protein